MWKVIRQKFDWTYLLIIALAVLMFVPFFSSLYIEGDDTYYHLANIESLASGSWWDLFTTKIFSGLGGDLGYGVGLFYPQLSHIVAGIFVKLGMSVVDGAKVAHILAMVLSGVLMYKLMKVVLEKIGVSGRRMKVAAFVAAVLYMAAPYHLTDSYTRDALAEVWVFPFLPLIFLSLVYFWQKKYKWFYLCFIIGFAGMANTHLVMAMYTAIFVILCLVLRGREFWRWEVIRKFMLAAVGVLLFCAPLVASIASMKFAGVDYVVYTDSSMISAGRTESDVLWPWQLLVFDLYYTDVISFAGNVVGMILVTYAAVRMWKLWRGRKKKRKVKKAWLDIDELINDREGFKGWVFRVGVLVTLVGLWMVSMLFPWIILPGIFQTIQFPWRLVMMVSFGISWLSGVMIGWIWEQKVRVLKKRRVKLGPILAGLALISSVIYTVAIIMNTTFMEIDLESDTAAESLYNQELGWQREYLPVAAKENLEYFDQRGAGAISLGDGWVEIGRIYYPGYEVKVNGEVVDYGMSENGFIKVQAEFDDEIEYEYVGTFAMRVAGWLPAVGIIYLFAISYFASRR